MSVSENYSPELQAIKNEGIEFECPYKFDNELQEKITRVKLPLSQELWADLLNKEGEHLGVCCGDVSLMRDLLQDALREDGVMECRELYRFATLAEDHGWKESDAENEPIGRIIKLWHRIQPVAELRLHVHASDPEDIHDAAHILFSGAAEISWQNLACNSGSHHDLIARTKTLRQMLPAIRTVYNHLLELDLGTATGIAICDKESGEPIEIARGGWAIYQGEKMCKEVIRHWKYNDPEIESKVVLRPCKVSVQKGIEGVENNKTVKVPKSKVQHADDCWREGLQQLIRDVLETYDLLTEWHLKSFYAPHISRVDEERCTAFNVDHA